jgi:hypothetical protein
VLWPTLLVRCDCISSSFSSHRAARCYVFQAYCGFTGGYSDDQMDSLKFGKLARDTGLINSRCSRTDVDVVFSAVKPMGQRAIPLEVFEEALYMLGGKLYSTLPPQEAYQRVVDTVIANASAAAASVRCTALRHAITLPYIAACWLLAACRRDRVWMSGCLDSGSCCLTSDLLRGCCSGYGYRQSCRRDETFAAEE